MVADIVNKLITKIKGTEFKVDVSISNIEMLEIICHRLAALLREYMHKLFLKESGSYFFTGRKVKLRYKSKIILGSGITLGDYVEIDALSRNGIILGNNVKIGNYSIIRCTGSLQNIGEGIIIDDNSSEGVS